MTLRKKVNDSEIERIREALTKRSLPKVARDYNVYESVIEEYLPPTSEKRKSGNSRK